MLLKESNEAPDTESPCTGTRERVDRLLSHGRMSELRQVQVYGGPKFVEWLADARAVADTPHNQYAALVKRLSSTSSMRPLAPPLQAAALDRLDRQFPHFDRVVGHLRRMTALSRLGGSQYVPPTLLAGPPGVGKTAFARAVANEMDIALEFIDLAAATAAFRMTGSAPQWGNSQPGTIFKTMVFGQYANPFILLDEVDKARGDARYSPDRALYTLLEPSTARGFVDEFVTFPIDASHINWILTANDVSRIATPLLNRMTVFDVAPPSFEQRRIIVRQLWSELRSNASWA